MAPTCNAGFKIVNAVLDVVHAEDCKAAVQEDLDLEDEDIATLIKKGENEKQDSEGND